MKRKELPTIVEFSSMMGSACFVSARLWGTFKTASDSLMIEEMPKPLSFIGSTLSGVEK